MSTRRTASDDLAHGRRTEKETPMNIGHERRRPASAVPHPSTLRNVLATGIKTMALLSLARQIGPRNAGRAATAVAGGYLRDLAHARGAKRRGGGPGARGAGRQPPPPPGRRRRRGGGK